MNLFKTQNGDILNLGHLISIEIAGAGAFGNYKIYLRGNSIAYISKQDYNRLCIRRIRFFSSKK